jgi:hypothetical protein
MPPAQPAEQQNSQPNAAQNPRHARQVSARHSTAGVLTARSTNHSSNISRRGRSISARQPLAATQAQVGDERKDAEKPQSVTDLKPQPPAAARSNANKPRPAKPTSLVSELYCSACLHPVLLALAQRTAHRVLQDNLVPGNTACTTYACVTGY